MENKPLPYNNCDYQETRETDWKRKVEGLSFWLDQIVGNIHEPYIHDSVSINRDILFKCIIELKREINHMKGYAIAYGKEQ